MKKVAKKTIVETRFVTIELENISPINTAQLNSDTPYIKNSTNNANPEVYCRTPPIIKIYADIKLITVICMK